MTPSRKSQQAFGIVMASFLVSCSPAAERPLMAETSWSLNCHGSETVEIITRGEIETKAGSETKVSLHWNAELGTLTLSDEVNEPVVFCSTPAVVNTRCNVRIDSGKLVARRTSLRQGSQPNSAIGFTEQIDVNLADLTGRSRVGYKMGSLGGNAAEITQQMLSKAELTCSRTE